MDEAQKNLSLTKDKSAAKQVIQKTQNRDTEQAESGKPQQNAQPFHWGPLHRNAGEAMNHSEVVGKEKAGRDDKWNVLYIIF